MIGVLTIIIIIKKRLSPCKLSQKEEDKFRCYGDVLSASYWCMISSFLKKKNSKIRKKPELIFFFF
jgi:hypothetical protein